jgi:hypothetical protein
MIKRVIVRDWSEQLYAGKDYIILRGYIIFYCRRSIFYAVWGTMSAAASLIL